MITPLPFGRGHHSAARVWMEKDSVDITLLGNYPNDENESMNRYAEMLKRLLAGHGHNVEIIRPEPYFGRLLRSVHGLGKWLGYLDKYILFPLQLRQYVRRRTSAEGFLVHICDHSNAVYTRWLQDVPHVVTCHDVMAIQSGRGLIPGHKTSRTGQVLQNWILSGLRRAAYIICVTEETRRDLLALAPELEDRSSTIENPLHYPFAPMSREEAIVEIAPLALNSFRSGEDRFLFHVGGNQWYKNREGVIRIFAQLRSTHPDLVRNQSLKLIMAGKPLTEGMYQLIRSEGLENSVISVTSVSDRQLCAFYNLAEALVFPSLKEGFGWPIIEAQACGCPVITSDRAPMNRIAGPVALLADPEDIFEFAAQLYHLLTEDTEFKQRRKEKAVCHAARYDSKVFAEQLLRIYGKNLQKK